VQIIHKIVLKVTGKKPIDIYQTILNKENIDIRKDHAAYLGRELQKAYIAIENGELIYANHGGDIRDAVRVEGSDHSEIPTKLGELDYLNYLLNFIRE